MNNQTNLVGQIADLIVIEALKRPRSKDDILASIHTVDMEVMKIIMDLAAEIRRSEHQREKEK